MEPLTISEILSLVGYAFEAIRSIVKDPVASAAADAANAIAAIYDAVDAATIGKVTPEMARAQIAGLMTALAANDAAADAALAAKFPKETP